MTDYTLFGTGTPSSANLQVYNSAELDGLEFYVTSSVWATALRFYRSSTSIGAPVVGAIYQVVTNTTGTLVPGTNVTWSLSGTGWQTAVISTPPRLATGVRYRIAVRYSGYRPYSGAHPYWSGNGPATNGITSGPLVAPNSANTTGGTQGFGVASSSLAYPTGSIYTDYWYAMDVTVTDVDPTGQSQSAFLPFFGGF